MTAIEAAGEVFPAIDTGTGPPLLFLHGAPGERRTWEEHSRLLSDRFRCIAFTQRYFGPGPWREDGPPFGTATHAADLIAIAEALAAGPVSIVAWSYGCHPVLSAALARPRLFRRILAFEPGFPTWITDPAELRAFEADAGAAWSDVGEAQQSGDEERLIRAMIDGSGGPGSFEAMREEDKAQMREGLNVLPRLTSQTPPVPLSCRELASIEVPVTIAWGARSRPCFTLPSRTAARCIGGDGRHVEVEGVNHLWPMQDPAGFAAFVAEWAA